MKAYPPLTRKFSAIEKLQAPYALTYALDTAGAGGGCRLSLSRTGETACNDSLVLDAPPQHCYPLLRYLYENAVQPEIWRDVVADFYPAVLQQNNGRGGASSDR